MDGGKLLVDQQMFHVSIISAHQALPASVGFAFSYPHPLHPFHTYHLFQNQSLTIIILCCIVRSLSFKGEP